MLIYLAPYLYDAQNSLKYSLRPLHQLHHPQPLVSYHFVSDLVVVEQDY